MKSIAKTSISLSAADLELVKELRVRLGVRSRLEVVRRGLRLLKETTDREYLREAYRMASAATRGMSTKW